jgi:hypothetical protein
MFSYRDRTRNSRFYPDAPRNFPATAEKFPCNLPRESLFTNELHHIPRKIPCQQGNRHRRDPGLSASMVDGPVGREQFRIASRRLVGH